MFDLSLAEIMLVVVVAVVFIGPKELPVVLRAIAKGIRALKGVSREVKKTFNDLAEQAGINDEIRMIKGDDGKWYESYPISSLRSAESSEQASPHPNPPPVGEGI